MRASTACHVSDQDTAGEEPAQGQQFQATLFLGSDGRLSEQGQNKSSEGGESSEVGGKRGVSEGDERARVWSECLSRRA